MHPRIHYLNYSIIYFLTYLVLKTPMHSLINTSSIRNSLYPPTNPLSNLLSNLNTYSLYSQSKAGLSDPSNQLIAFTLCGWPDAPPSIEILKVTENGLLLSWLPPMRDNGMKGIILSTQHNISSIPKHFLSSLHSSLMLLSPFPHLS